MIRIPKINLNRDFYWLQVPHLTENMSFYESVKNLRKFFFYNIYWF